MMGRARARILSLATALGIGSLTPSASRPDVSYSSVTPTRSREDIERGERNAARQKSERDIDDWNEAVDRKKQARAERRAGRPF